MRVITALLICLGMTNCGLSSLAQTSTSVPSAPASRAESAIEIPRAPVFEYLGRLRAETGTRTVVENGPQGTRTIVQIVSGWFEGPRVKASVLGLTLVTGDPRLLGLGTIATLANR